MMLPLAMIPKHYLGHGARHICREVFIRRRPRSGLRKSEFDGGNDSFGRCSAQNVAAAFYGLSTLGNIAKRYIRDLENATFFLDRSAVGKDGKGVLFKFYEIEKSHCVEQADLVARRRDPEFGEL